MLAPTNQIEDELIYLDPSQPSDTFTNYEQAPRINIAGRKLFQDDFDDTPVARIQKLKKPVMLSEVQFQWEKANSTATTSSPEVQFIGEKVKSTKEKDKINSPEVLFLGEMQGRVVQRSSLEVQGLGERVFKNVYNNMSEKADETYNVGLSLGTSSVSRGKENIRPLRVVEPSIWLRSPFENNSKTIIEPYELKIYETIMTLCNDPNHQDRWVINMNNCRVSLNQLGNSTKPNGWVDSWVINALCRKLFKDKYPKQSDKHFFFHTSAEFFLEKWPNEYMKNIWHRNVIKKFLAADSAKKLHLSKRLHFPALYDDHWFVFAVDIKTRNFLFLDSLYGQSSKLHQQLDDKLISNFRKNWKDCKLKDLHFESFGKHYPNLPQQKTRNDWYFHYQIYGEVLHKESSDLLIFCKGHS